MPGGACWSMGMRWACIWLERTWPFAHEGEEGLEEALFDKDRVHFFPDLVHNPVSHVSILPRREQRRLGEAENEGDKEGSVEDGENGMVFDIWAILMKTKVEGRRMKNEWVHISSHLLVEQMRWAAKCSLHPVLYCLSRPQMQIAKETWSWSPWDTFMDRHFSFLSLHIHGLTS